MPAPAKITGDQLRATTAVLVEDLGPTAVSMRLVADRLGVRAPSLYKHVADREALLGLVRDGAIADIGSAMAAAEREAPTADPAERLRAHAHAVRRYAHRRPQAFGLVFQPSHLPQSAPETLVASISLLLRACDELVGPQRALEAARTLTAWLTGFISMENAAAFQLDGDVDEAFTYGAEAVIAGIAASATRR